MEKVDLKVVRRLSSQLSSIASGDSLSLKCSDDHEASDSDDTYKAVSKKDYVTEKDESIDDDALSSLRESSITSSSFEEHKGPTKAPTIKSKKTR
jgi:hypothetical protein